MYNTCNDIAKTPALRRLWRFSIVFFFCVCLCGQSKDILAQQVPNKVQVVIFKKVFMFCKTLRSQEIKVLVVYNDATMSQKDEVVEEFKKIGVTATGVRLGQLPQTISATTVLYILPGCSSVRNIARSSNLLTISGEPNYAEKGECSIALADENGKPRILINTASLKSEGQELSAEVMKISRIIE